MRFIKKLNIESRFDVDQCYVNLWIAYDKNDLINIDVEVI